MNLSRILLLLMPDHLTVMAGGKERSFSLSVRFALGGSAEGWPDRRGFRVLLETDRGIRL